MTIDKKFDINALACSYGADYKIERRKDEPDDKYRIRVAGELRSQGYLIEAHEAFSGRRYDDPVQGPTETMVGIFGAVAQAFQNRAYSPHDLEQQMDNDIAAGVIVRSGKDQAASNIKTIFGLLGPSAGMDLLEANYNSKSK